MNNFGGIFLVLSLARESELVFGLAVGNFVDPVEGRTCQSIVTRVNTREEPFGRGKKEGYAPEPLVGGTHEAGEVTFDIFNIVQLGCERVLDVDDEDLPVGLAFVEKGHDAEDLDLFDLPDITHLFTDLADVQRIVVTPGLGLSMQLSGVLPSLYIRKIEG
jgi:hypothetical protein